MNKVQNASIFDTIINSSEAPPPTAQTVLNVFFFFLWIKHSVDGWHFEYPKWWDLFKQAHQHLACLACQGRMIPVWRFELLPHGRAWYLPPQTIDRPLCFSSALWHFSGGIHRKHFEIWLEQWPGLFGMVLGPGWRDNIADIHRDLKVCERQMMEHLFAWGH